ncbi:uncharacterized protein PRCAT00005868001 [Priceomyces carsonii]|uniref:uncharacterized protein n=1 Tax=Priceomyces carsonii TaxID=28549 RepID=UPI002ED91C57|nr:unnamed protein product [Priceomyces carsonii]
MCDTTGINIRGCKRRVVPFNKRRNSVLSCDRCKRQKKACIRENGDPLGSKGSCVQCKKVNQECRVTIQRKKRKIPSESLGLHYKCLFSIVKAAFPDVDINSIDELINLGISVGANMPSRNGLNKGEIQELENIARSLTTSKRFDPSSYISYDVTEEEINCDNNPITIRLEDKDIFLAGREENLHYVGLFGETSTIFKVMNETLEKSERLPQVKKDQYQNALRSQHVIRSLDHSYEFLNLKETFGNIIHLEEELNGYVDSFFNNVHPFCFCFDEHNFRSLCGMFWSQLKYDGIEEQKIPKIPKIPILCICLIWIIGKYFQPPSESSKFDDIIIKNHLELVRSSMADIVMLPSLNSIKCLLLFILYLDYCEYGESGYVLSEIALSHAHSLGIHRLSVTKYLRDENEVFDCQIIWWALYQRMLQFSGRMGRSIAIRPNEITTSYPNFNDVGDRQYKIFFERSIDLNKIYHFSLEFQNSVTSYEQLFLDKNISQALEIKERFLLLNNKIESCVSRPLDLMSPYIFRLKLTFHYYHESILFPYLLYATEHGKIFKEQPSVFSLIQQCIKSSILMYELLKVVNESTRSNYHSSPYVYFVYHSTLCLLVGYQWMSSLSKRGLDLQILSNSLEQDLQYVSGALDFLRNYNNKFHSHLKGSLLVLNKCINFLMKAIYENEDNFLGGGTSPIIYKTIDISPPPLDEDSYFIHDSIFSIIDSIFEEEISKTEMGIAETLTFQDMGV